MDKPRVTQQDIADKAGVTRATVSMALNNHPSIPVRTRKRIAGIAARLGYAPDPMLSALAAYRSRNRPATYHGTLAWLVNSAFGHNWRRTQHFIDFHDGAVARARRHGFGLEVYDFNQPKVTPDRLAAILRARNISGLLLSPQPRSDTVIDFPWRDFSTVTFGYSLSSPHLHTVVSTQYRDMRLTLEQVQKLGYRRIGLVLAKDHDLRTDRNYLAAYLVHEYGAEGEPPPPPLLLANYEDAATLGVWLRRHRPDAIVGAVKDVILRDLRQLAVRVPEDLGVAFPNLVRPDPRVAGVVESSTEIGAVAVDVLVAMIHRGERGVPEFPQRIHVEGRWTPGKSLRTVAGGA
ncbi:MAG: LacI family DNA-binding transcriptional regulator [Opitutaceae bacterium]|jgi:DNA-binding LacI/PurR family transcriptional regulator|nr:LacI family DNA-binding transcriptional regulator [Opitutaceae bacterium]